MPQKLKIIAAAALESAGAAVVCHYFFRRLRAFDPVYEVLYLQPAPYWSAVLLFLLFLALFLFLPAGRQGRAERVRDWMPLPFAGALLLPQFDSVLPLLGAFLLTGWGACRYASNLAGGETALSGKAPLLSPRTGAALAVLFGMLGVFWGFHLQRTAGNTLFLFYHDWGEYAEHYRRLAFSADIRPIDWLVGGGHWNGAVNLLMSAAIRLVPAPETIFLLNSVMIFSAVPLVYLLGRRLKLPVATALVFALFFLFS